MAVLGQALQISPNKTSGVDVADVPPCGERGGRERLLRGERGSNFNLGLYRTKGKGGYEYKVNVYPPPGGTQEEWYPVEPSLLAAAPR